MDGIEMRAKFALVLGLKCTEPADFRHVALPKTGLGR